MRRWRLRLAGIDLGSLAYLAGIIVVGVTALTIGIAKGLQTVGVIKKAPDFGAGAGAEQAAVAWRSEAEAREAQVKRQDEEIGRLTDLVAKLGKRLDDAIIEIHDLKVQRDELLARPDYGVLLERFTTVEETAMATLTLLRAHDELTLTRVELPPVIEKLEAIAKAVVPPDSPLD